jgi:processive 1,2-diacylglycerol beta-glucosyltransferase
MRVLIATVTVGSGHQQAALALEAAWNQSRPTDTVQHVDVLEYASPLYRKLHKDTYLTIVEHAPELYAMVFKKTDNPELTQKLGRFYRGFTRAVNARFVAHLREFKPEVMLCSHYLPLEVAGSLKHKEAWFRPFTVCVVTDFEAHALWMGPAVDIYCVAAEETKARLVARGAAPEKVLVSGIPISAKFSQPLDASKIRRALGLRDDLPVLLVLGGGFGLGPVGRILAEIDKISHLVQVLVVAGRNQDLRRELAAIDFKQPTRVLGFVANMQELMSVASLIITKPGGLTSSEALALGKPLFIVNPIPGQEEANSDFLLQKGAAVKVNRIEDIPFRLEQLIGSSALADLAAKAKLLGQPYAAQKICEFIQTNPQFQSPKPLASRAKNR